MIIEPSNRIKAIKEYYFSRKLREIDLANQQGADIINLGIGNPDLTPSQVTIDRLISGINEPTAHQYQSYRGIKALRQSMSVWYKNNYGITINSDSEILPLLGSKEGVMHLSMSFLQEGDEVLVPNPGYPAYRSASLMAGAKVLPYHLTEENDYFPDLDFLRMFSLKRVKIMWVNYSNMPTGATITKEHLQRLVTFAKEEKILLAFDNPYGFILNDNPLSIFSIPGAKDVAIEFNSLSKMYNMAGWRVGFVAGKSEYINEILKFKSNMDSGMFLPVQLAAIEALQMGKEWNDSLNAIYEKRRQIVWELLDNLECTYRKDSAGLFVWARIPKAIESGEVFVAKILSEARVFITPGFIFGSNGDRFLRVSLCSEVKVYEQAITRIKEMQML